MKKLLYLVIGVVILVVLAGIIKFNFINDDIYFQNEKGEYVNTYGKKIVFLWHRRDLCDKNRKRYKTAKKARNAGLKESEFDRTFCPEYKMDPS